MTVVADEARSAVWAEQAAERVWQLAASPITGLRHLATSAIGRPELAAYLDRRFAIGARITLQHRRDRNAPHPGRIELRTIFQDEYATALAPVVS
jgi:dTDP-4-dehydrorhamnose reductase